MNSGEYQQPVIITKNFVLGGIPASTLETLVVSLLNMYGIGHNVPYRADFANEASLETGDPNLDQRNANEFIVFKMFVDGLSEYNETHCKVQTTGIGLFLTFTCR
jgi:hypothetical protein